MLTIHGFNLSSSNSLAENVLLILSFLDLKHKRTSVVIKAEIVRMALQTRQEFTGFCISGKYRQIP